MTTMPPHGVAPLLHLLGFLTGLALCGLLLTLGARTSGAWGSGPALDRLPVATALLGLVWNVGGLATLALHDILGRGPHPLLVAAAYGALGFLPAVAVHAALRTSSRERTSRSAAVVIASAYAVSTVAQLVMLAAALRGVAPSTPALGILTWSYAALVLPVLWMTRRARRGARAWSIVALAVFAVSALHLAQHGGGESWPVELVGHHASILLIFAILYQDFRFALADLFLKRALTLSALLSLATALYFLVEAPVLSEHPVSGDPVALGVTLVLWVALALSYPGLRRAAGWTVDAAVLRRADPEVVTERLQGRIAALEHPEEVLAAVVDELRGDLAGIEVGWGDGAPPAAGRVVVPVPTTEAPHFALTLGLPPGRRLLSGDSELLARVGRIAGRRIDALRLSRERFEHRLREREILRLASEAELEALRAQVQPHFLFNALNTIAFLIQSAPERAYDTLLQLTSLLRAVLSPGRAMVTVGDEVRLVEAYLEIERARFEERLAVAYDVPEALGCLPVPPLLLQPLVENAVKHGIAKSRRGGRIEIRARRDDAGLLVVTVSNGGRPTDDAEIAAGRRRGVGLANLEARLRHHYGAAASLRLHATPTTTTAEVVLPIETAGTTPVPARPEAEEAG